MGKITPKQKRFAREYVVDLNATQAAIRCGYSEKTAKVQGSRLLTNANVQALVAELSQKIEDNLEVKATTVLRELLRISTSDLLQIFKEDGSLRDMKDIPEDTRRAISSVEVVESAVKVGVDEDGNADFQPVVTKKFKLWDKTKGLEMLAKHKKLLTDKLEIEGQLTLEELVLGAHGLEKHKSGAILPKDEKAAS